MLQKHWMKFNIIPASNLTKPQFNIIAIIFFNSSHFSKHTGCPKNVEGRFWTKNLAEKETPRDFLKIYSLTDWGL